MCQFLMNIDIGNHFVDLNYHYGATGWPLFIDFGQMNLTINVDEWQNKPFVMEPSYYTVGYIIKTKQID